MDSVNSGDTWSVHHRQPGMERTCRAGNSSSDPSAAIFKTRVTPSNQKGSRVEGGQCCAHFIRGGLCFIPQYLNKEDVGIGLRGDTFTSQQERP